MDSGDEMADAAYRSMQQSAQDFMRWMTGYGRMGGRGSNLLQRMTDRSQSLSEAIAQRGEEKAAAAADKGSPGVIEFCASSPEELAVLEDRLSSLGVEHYAEPSDVPYKAPVEKAASLDLSAIEPDEDGIYSLWVADRKPAAKLSPMLGGKALVSSRAGYVLASEVSDSEWEALEERFSPAAVASRAAVTPTMKEAAKDVPDAAKAKVIPGDPSNVGFSIETVRWDRESKLLTATIGSLGIPVETEVLDGTVRYEVTRAAAPHVKEAIDAMCGYVPGFNRSRFEGYEALEEASLPGLDAVMEGTIQGEEEAAIVMESLSAAGIDFESSYDRASDECTFTVKERDLERGREKLTEVIEGLTESTEQQPGLRFPPERFAECAARAKSEHGTREPKAQDATRFERNRKPTPVHDQKRAVQSAEARNKVELPRERTMRRGK